MSSSPGRLDARGVATFILAGGEGRRLLPLTQETPKPAVPFGPNGRVIDFVVENCLAAGIACAAVITQYQPVPLESYLAGRHAPRFREAGGTLALVRTGTPGSPARTGTADAILDDLRHLRADLGQLLVLAADHAYRMDYEAFLDAHESAGADLTVAATRVPLAEAGRFGVFQTDGTGRVKGFAEKPASPASMPDDPDHALVSMGIYLFRRGPLEEARRAIGRAGGVDFGRDVVPAILGRGGRVQVFRHREPGSDADGLWFDVGTPEALLAANLVFHPEGAVAATARVAAGASVRQSVIREGAHVERSARVEESFILDGAVVERGAVVRRAIVGPGSRVPAGATVAPHHPERAVVHSRA